MGRLFRVRWAEVPCESQSSLTAISQVSRCKISFSAKLLALKASAPSSTSSLPATLEQLAYMNQFRDLAESESSRTVESGLRKTSEA